MILIVLFFLGILAFIAYKFWDKSFRNKAMIARQTGINIDDVIWINERFKVVNVNGSWKIIFRHIREKTGSIEGKFWTKFSKTKPKTTTYNEDEWKKKDMSKLIQRGLFLYETSEGVLFPMKITRSETDDFTFNIVDQDNRMFLINEIEHVESLTKNPRSEMVKLVAIIVAIVVLGVTFAGGMYAMNSEGQQNVIQSAQVCGEYARAIFNSTMYGGKEYISNIPIPLPGG